MNTVFVLSSVTYALKSQDLLRRESIYASITRSPAVKAVKGCGYGLVVPGTCEAFAKTILQRNGINIIAVIPER